MIPRFYPAREFATAGGAANWTTRSRLLLKNGIDGDQYCSGALLDERYESGFKLII
jgi:hypothetical protein